MSTEDDLRSQLHRAQEELAAANERDNRATETINTLRGLLSEYDSLVERGHLMAWERVWKKCQEHGIESFIGGDGTGVSRVLAFIDHLAKKEG